MQLSIEIYTQTAKGGGSGVNNPFGPDMRAAGRGTPEV